jgi:hypothetical protein
VPLILGIFLEWYSALSLQTLAGISVAAIALLFLANIPNLKLAVYRVAIAFVVMALMGCWLVLLSNQKNHKEFIDILRDDVRFLINKNYIFASTFLDGYKCSVLE